MQMVFRGPPDFNLFCREPSLRTEVDVVCGLGRRDMPFAHHAAVVHRITPGNSNQEPESTGQASYTIKRVKRVALSVAASKRVKLFRLKLAERLLLEADLQRGLRRLINQTFICLFTVAALNWGGGGENVKRGVYQHLAVNFGIAGFRAVKDRATLKTVVLPNVASASKKHSLLSSNYFVAASYGDVEVVGPAETFFRPRLFAATNLNLAVPSFSFSAWVRLDPSYKTGYLMKKIPSTESYTGPGVCWGWYIDSDQGPALHYGVHDSAPPLFGADNVEQVSVSPAAPDAFESSKNFLLTIVVEGKNVTFYKDRTASGPYQLPRRVTDCNNNYEGILVGAPGVKMTQLRFYASALNGEQVGEMFRYGMRLSDISSGSDPFSVNKEYVADALMHQSILSASAQVIQKLHDSDEIQDRTVALHKAAVDGEQHSESYFSPEFPEGSIPSHSYVGNISGVESHRILIDQHAGNHSYYSLIAGPARLSKTSGEKARLLTHLPTWSGTGATFSYWYRHTPFESGLYLFWAFDDNQAVCWSLWVEDGAVWYDNPQGETHKYEYIYFSSLGMSPKFYWQGDVTWRHVALQFDEVTDR